MSSRPPTLLGADGNVLVWPASSGAEPLRYNSSRGVVREAQQYQQLPSSRPEPRAAAVGFPPPSQAPQPQPAVPRLARNKSLAAIYQQRAAPKSANIAVGVRARPLNDAEASNGEYDAWGFDETRGRMWEQLQQQQQLQKEYTFDHVFSPASTTEAVYRSMAAPLVTSALEGVNSTLLAYGQTGAGKSFSLIGGGEEPGIVAFAVHDLFRRMEEEQQASGDVEWLVRISMLELYREELRDLLNPAASSSLQAGAGMATEVTGTGGAAASAAATAAAALKIVDDPVQGPFVRNLTEEIVLSPERVMELVSIGEGNRTVAATNMNARSSRSHCIVRLVIESRRREGVDGTGRMDPSVAALMTGRRSSAGNGGGPAALVRVASLTFVDLAGSERVSKTGGTSGLQIKESGMINSSLLTLGLCINKLVFLGGGGGASGGGGGGAAGSEGPLSSPLSHIPYRDSKLTRLLSTSLGGNALTSILIAISPSVASLGETRSSLAFAERAMRVVNRARVNEVADETALLAHYRSEIAQLKAALLEGRGGMIITADGSVVTAEAMLDRMKQAHEESQKEMESQLREQEDNVNEANNHLSDLLQLCFVASHACGHMQSSPFVLETLAEVAAGTLSASFAVRRLVSSVPGFRRRMTRLLRNQHIKALSGSELEDELFSGTGFEDELQQGNEEAMATVVAGVAPPLSLSGSSSRLAQTANAMVSSALAASSVEWSAAGPAATVVRLSSRSRGNSRAASPDATSRSLASVVGSPQAIARPGPLESPSPSPFASPRFSQLDQLNETMASRTSRGGARSPSRSPSPSPSPSPSSLRYRQTEAPLAASLAASASSPVTVLAVDYFSPASFGKQLETLLGDKEALMIRTAEQEATITSLRQQLEQAQRATQERDHSLSLLQSQFDEVELENARLVDEASANFLTSKAQVEELEILKARSANAESEAKRATLELNSLRTQHEALSRRAKEVSSSLEQQLQEEMTARRRLEVEARDHEPVMKALQHAKDLAERERDAALADLQDERKRGDDLATRSRTLHADNEAQALLIEKLESEVSTATASLELLRAQVGEGEAHLEASLALERAAAIEIRDSLERQLKEAVLDRDHYEKELKDARAQKEDLAELSSQLQGEVKLLRSDLQTLRNEKQAEVTALQQQVNAAAASHRYALRKEQDSARAAQAEAEGLKGQVQALTLELQGEIQRADDSENALEDLRQRLLAVDKDKEGLNAKLFSLESQVRQLERAKEALDIKLRAQQQEIEASGAQLSALLADLRPGLAIAAAAAVGAGTPANSGAAAMPSGRRASAIGRRMTVVGSALSQSLLSTSDASSPSSSSSSSSPSSASSASLKHLVDSLSLELSRLQSSSSSSRTEVSDLQARVKWLEEEKRASEGKLEAVRRLLQSLTSHATATIPEFAGAASDKAVIARRLSSVGYEENDDDDDEEEERDGNGNNSSSTLDETPRKAALPRRASSTAPDVATAAWKSFPFEQQIADVFEGLRAVHARLRRTEDEVAAFKRALTARETELEVLVKEQQRSDNSLLRDLKTASQRCEVLRAQLDKAEGLIAELQAVNDAQERSLAAVRGELALQVQENGALKDDLMQCRRDIVLAKEEASSFQADLSFALSELDEEKGRVAALRDELLRARKDNERQLEMAVGGVAMALQQGQQP